VIVLFIVLATILGLLLWFTQVYNHLVALKGQFENGFAQIEVQLRRRYDLIPNLVETVRGYLQHENQTLTAVIEARNAAHALLKAASLHPGDSQAMVQLGQAESQLMQALGGLNVQMEAYPDLKANRQIAQLFEELTATENRVAFARQAFNDGVTAYNIYRKQFPAILLASRVGHTDDASLLEIDAPELYHQTPQINLTSPR
jgi:LemA protein